MSLKTFISEAKSQVWVLTFHDNSDSVHDVIEGLELFSSEKKLIAFVLEQALDDVAWDDLKGFETEDDFNKAVEGLTTVGKLRSFLEKHELHPYDEFITSTCHID